MPLHTFGVRNTGLRCVWLIGHRQTEWGSVRVSICAVLVHFVSDSGSAGSETHLFYSIFRHAMTRFHQSEWRCKWCISQHLSAYIYQQCRPVQHPSWRMPLNKRERSSIRRGALKPLHLLRKGWQHKIDMHFSRKRHWKCQKEWIIIKRETEKTCEWEREREVRKRRNRQGVPCGLRWHSCFLEARFPVVFGSMADTQCRGWWETILMAMVWWQI